MFRSQFKTLLHNVIPEDSQRLSILRVLLAPEVRVRIAETFDSPDLYRTALKKL